MSSFDDREKGFEAKYRVDQESQFKIIARRNKLLGEWAAGQMGLSGDGASAYAKEVVASDFEKPGDDDVVEKVQADFEGKGIKLGAADIRKKMDELLALARDQIVGTK
jgi:hypothetical protein